MNAKKIVPWVVGFLLVVGAVILPSLMGPSAKTKEVLKQAEKGTFTPPPVIKAPQPETMTVTLDSGSNPWKLTKAILESSGLKHPTKRQVRAATKLLCAQNAISVPAWSLSGHISDRALMPGKELTTSVEDLLVVAQAASGR